MAEAGQANKHGRRRWLWIGTTIVLVAAASGATWWFTRPTDTAAATTPTTSTRSVAASVQTLKRTISTTGSLTPADQREVSFGASGEVTSVKVAEGDTVKKGQVLGTIGTVGLKADLATAKSTLAQAKARVVSDKTAVEDAADTDSTTDDTTTKAQLVADRAAVTNAQAGVSDAEDALAAATLKSPITGLVAEVNVAVGDSVSGSSSSTSSSGSSAGSSGSGGSGASGATGTSGSSGSASSSSSSSTPFVVVATNSWKVDVTIDDSEINLLKKGLQAQLTIDGIDDTLFGTVSSVGLISTSTGDTASYPVEIEVTGSPKGVHDGSAATIAIIYQQLTDVLTVPSTAVHQENGQSVVYQTVNGAQQSTVVEAGDTLDNYTVITSGLAEGDEVLVTTTTVTGNRTGSGTENQNGNGYNQNGRGYNQNGGSFPGGGQFPVGGGQFPAGGQVPAGGQSDFGGGR